MQGENKIFVKRFNPEIDGNPTLQEYEVPSREQMTVLEALQYIYEEIDSTLLFDFGCRYRLCKKCGIRISGQNRLACAEFVKDGMVLEPLPNHPVIRDLKID